MSLAYGFGLPHWQPLSGGFNPSSLFVGGVQGTWYDPSDASTLFEDTAGTTPSPTPGAGALSVVGLMLDKSQNGVGTNGSFRYNRATYTQTFGTSWTNTDTTIISTNNLAPDGTLTASLLTASGTTPYFYNSFSTSPSTTNVCSLHVKAGTASVFWLYFNNSAPDGTAYFDLSDLTTQAVAGSSQTPANLTISNLGNGWYRISASWNNSQPTFNWGFGFCDAKGSVNCTVGRTAQVWGFQLQAGTTPTTYQRIDANWYSTMAGNHAISYNTTTARPELSARVNLLTYSEAFEITNSVPVSGGSGNFTNGETVTATGGGTGVYVAAQSTTTIFAISGGSGTFSGTLTGGTSGATRTIGAGVAGAWTLNANINAFGSGSVVNATTAPDNTITADLLTENTATGDRNFLQLVTSASAVTQSIYVKPNGRTWVYLQMSYVGGTPPVVADRRVWFNCVGSGSVGTVGAQYSSPSITALPNGWYRISAVINPASTGSTGSNVVFGFTTADATVSYTGNGTSGIFIWGADLRLANIGTSVPAYQRIADQYTYDSSGFPRYFIANGTATGMYTPNNLNLSGTDKVTVFAGVRKQSDAAAGVLAELSNNYNNNANTFAVFIPSGANTQVSSGISNGSGLYNQAYYTDSAAPISTVNSTAYNKALTADQVVFIRKNGSDQTLTRSLNNNTGQTNFGSYPLNIGVRSATATPSLFFNGYIYSLIVVGSSLSAAQISSTESWINGKEGGVY